MKGGLRTKNINKISKVNEPLVSIITVVFNGQKHIEQTIKSVLGQTYKNVEYIIIDGNSMDGTIDIIKSYDEQLDFWISEPDRGIYEAMNKGIVHAKGEIIGIINADDYYEPDAIKYIVDSHLINKADIYYGDMKIIDGKGAGNIVKPDISKMNEKPSIFHPTCFVRKDVYDHAGLFDIRYKISSDYEFLLRCLRKKYFFHYVPEVITAFRQGGISGSCYSNVEGYKIMKQYSTGHQNEVIWRGIKCYAKTFIKKIINLGR